MSMTATSMSAMSTATCGFVDNQYDIQSFAAGGPNTHLNEIICTDPGSFCAYEPNLRLMQCVPPLTSVANMTASRTYSGVPGSATGYTALFRTSCIDSVNATQTTTDPYVLTCTDSTYSLCASISADLVVGQFPTKGLWFFVTCANYGLDPEEVLDPVRLDGPLTATKSIEYLAMVPVTMAQFTTDPPTTTIAGLGNGGGAWPAPAGFASEASATVNSNPNLASAAPTRNVLKFKGMLAVVLAMSLLLA